MAYFFPFSFKTLPDDFGEPNSSVSQFCSLIAHGGDHARRALLSGRVRIGVCPWRVTFADLILIANTRLIAPVDHRLVALCPRRD